MKRYITPLLILAALGACRSDDDPQPAADPFLGSWTYESTGLDLKTSFTVHTFESEYQFSNISIEYSEIPATEKLSYRMEVSDPFTDHGGFGRIRLTASWTTTCANGMECDKWIFVDFNYSKMMTSGTTISVQNVDVYMINRDEIIIEDQKITRL